MSREKETQVQKSNNFEEWRQKSNQVSLDLGTVGAKRIYSQSELTSGNPNVVDSLDSQPLLSDRYKSSSLANDNTFVRDVTSSGLQLDYASERKVDNTEGYIILKDGISSTNLVSGGNIVLKAGDVIRQYSGNQTNNPIQFSAIIESISQKKILVRSISGTAGFDSGLNIYGTDNNDIKVPSSYIKEIVVESYPYVNARVYKTRNYTFQSSSAGAAGNYITLNAAQYQIIQPDEKLIYADPGGTRLLGGAGATTIGFVKKTDDTNRRIQLVTAAGGSSVIAITDTATSTNHTLNGEKITVPQDLTRNGFHIPFDGAKAAFTTHTINAADLPETFLENETVFQTAGNTAVQTSNGVITNATFEAKLMTITGADADTTGAGTGLLIFKSFTGAFNNTLNLQSFNTKLGGGGDASATFANNANQKAIAAAGLNSTLTASNANYAQMIELNSIGVAGDAVEIYYGSAIDAILEVQDDIGNITSLGTTDKTDIVTAINELETAIRHDTSVVVSSAASGGLVYHGTTNTGGMTANNLLDGLREHEADLFGAAGNKRTLASLGTTDKASIVDAINELETAIRGASADSVETILGSTSSRPALTANDLAAAIVEHEVDLFGTGSQTLASLGTNDQASIVNAINELETAIRGGDGTLVGTDLAQTLAPYTNAGTNLTDLIEELVRDIGDVTQTKLGVLNNPTLNLNVGNENEPTNETSIKMASVVGIKVGMFVSGHASIDTTTGGGAFVIAISSPNITLSRGLTQQLPSGTQLTFKVEDLVTKVKGLDTAMGAVTASNMGTAASTLTTAIREHNDELYSSGVSFTGLVAVNFQDAIEELRVDIGDVGNAGAELAGVALPSTISNLTDAVKDIVSRMTGGVEFDTQAFHATHANGLAGINAAYDETNFLAAIREIQTYLGTPTLLSVDVEGTTTAAAAANAGTSPQFIFASAPSAIGGTAVDVGFEITGNGISGTAKIIQKISDTVFVLDKSHDASSNGETMTIKRPVDHLFDSDNITDSLIELRTALVGGSADLSDKIATLDDSDGNGTGTDFNVTNVVDAIREIQDDIGTLSSLTNTPFNSDNNKIQGTYTPGTIVSTIASYGEYIGAADISGISTANNTITEAINKLHGEVGDIAGLSAMTATDLTSAVLEHETDLYTSTSGSFTGLTSKHFKGAIEETVGELGDVTTINNATGYVATTAVGGILELQTDVGDVTSANLGAVNTSINKATDAIAVHTGNNKTIPLANTIGLVVGMTVTSNTNSTDIADGSKIASIDPGVSVTLDKDIVAEIGSGDSLTFKTNDLTNAIRAIEDRIGSEVNSTNLGTAANQIVPAIAEIAGEIGAVTQSNLGTTATNLTAAIKELVDGTGAAAITVASVASQSSTGKLDKVSGTTVVANVNLSSAASTGNTTLTFANAAAIAGVEVGAVVSGSASISTGTYVQSINGAVITLSAAVGGGIATNVNLTFTMDQSIIGNINFISPNSNTSATANKTRFVFGPNTELDISAGTLITQSANADFTTAAKKVVLGANINNGQGLEIDRSAISSAVGNTNIDPSLLWVDLDVTNLNDAAAAVNGTTSGSTTAATGGSSQQMTVTDASNINVGMVLSGDSPANSIIVGGTTVISKSSNTLTLSHQFKGSLPAGTYNFNTHNRNDLSWQITGFKPTTTPDNIDTKYIAPNVDFFNAERLFDTGTSGETNTHSNISASWSAEHQRFTLSLNDTTTNLTTGGTGASNTWGTSAKVPQLDIDRQGRIIGVTEVAIVDALGTFTLKSDGGTDQVIGVNESIDIAGGTNITTALTENSGANTVTVNLDASPSVTNLTASGKLVVQGTDAAHPSTFAGDVTVAGECRANLFTQTGGGTSLSFTSTSAEVSTGELILNSQQTGELANTAGETSSARFIAHRGFDTTTGNLKTGRNNTLTIGKRYRIQVLAAADQAELKAIAGNSSLSDFSVGGILTATTTGNDGISGSSTTRLAEQFPEAKIAWNEDTDKWEIYNGSDTTAGSIVTQGDTLTATLSSTALVTAATNDENEDKQITFVDVTGSTSTIQRDAGLVYNPSTNNLTVKFGTAETKISAGESFFHNNTHIVSSTPTVATNTYAARSVQVKGSNSFVKLTETRDATESTTNTGISGTEITNLATMVNGKFYQITNMGSANNFQALINVASGQNGKDFAGNALTAALGVKFRYINNANGGVDATGTGAKVKEVVADPTWYVGADGGNFSIRLNNQGTYPLNIQTTQIGTGVRDGFTSSRIDLNYPTLVNAALTSNQIVATGSQTDSFGLVTAGQADNINNSIVNSFYANDISDAAKTLSSTNLSVLKNAIFAARTGSGGNINYFEIQDVRNIVTETSPSTGYSVSSHKRLQMRVANDDKQGVLLGFIDFDADEASEKIYIGGINAGVNKTSIESNARGAAKLYFNENGSGTAASEKLATTTDGIKVTGEIETTSNVGIGGAPSNTAGELLHLQSSSTNDVKLIIEADSGDNNSGGDSANAQLLLLQDGQKIGGRIETTNGGNVQATGSLDNSLLISSLRLASNNNINNQGALQFATNGDAPDSGTDKPTVRMTITAADGNVGIGTNSPDSLLELVDANPVLTIRDTDTDTATNDARLRLAESGSSDALDNYIDLGYVANEFIINRSGLNQLKIDSSGNVGIGKTPGSKLDVNGAVEADSFRFTGNVATIQTVPSIRQGSATAFNFDSPGGFRFTLDSDRTDGQTPPSSNHTFTIAKSATDATDANSKPVFLVSEAGDVEFYKSTSQDDTDNAADFHYDSQNGGKLGLGTSTPGSVNSDKLIIGDTYTIVTPGGQNFTTVGAGDSAIGTVFTATGTTTGGSAGKVRHGATKLDVIGNVKHSGLTMTPGTDIDQLYTLGPVAISTTDYNGQWQDTSIEGADIADGSYMVQLYVNEGGSGVFQTYYTGYMSWRGATNGTETDEINLHSAGHDSKEDDGNGWFLRTQCNTTGGGAKCKLQIRSDHNAVNAGTYTIKLRRMI